MSKTRKYYRRHKLKTRSRNRKRYRKRGGATPYPPNSIYSYIHHVVYINLDSRKDRKQQIDEQLKNFPKDKVHRVSGVEDKEYPYLGCIKGHLSAIKLAVENGWDNVLILEDDSMWSNIDTAYPIFKKLVNNPYDVIMLGGTMSEFDKQTFKVYKSKSSASYLVNRKYYDTILRKIEEVINSFKPGVTTDDEITPDVAVFYPLQAADSWFIISPALMVQHAGYSSILSKEINYTPLFS